MTRGKIILLIALGVSCAAVNLPLFFDDSATADSIEEDEFAGDPEGQTPAMSREAEVRSLDFETTAGRLKTRLVNNSSTFGSPELTDYDPFRELSEPTEAPEDVSLPVEPTVVIDSGVELIEVGELRKEPFNAILYSPGGGLIRFAGYTIRPGMQIPGYRATLHRVHRDRVEVQIDGELFTLYMNDIGQGGGELLLDDQDGSGEGDELQADLNEGIDDVDDDSN